MQTGQRNCMSTQETKLNGSYGPAVGENVISTLLSKVKSPSSAMKFMPSALVDTKGDVMAMSPLGENVTVPIVTSP
jgi:hypothetical protein